MSDAQNPSLKPHRATVILVLGILGLVLCQPLGIAAWVMGNKDLKEMTAGLMDPSGQGMTNAGRICGMIATALLALFVVFGLISVVLGVLSAR